MTKTQQYILIALAAVIIIGVIVYLNRLTTKASELKGDCFNLPENVPTETWGPEYWKAFHSLAHKVPCTACRTFAEKFMIFFHDLVNLKTHKKLWDESNFNEMSSLIIKIKNSNNTWTS